MRQCLEKLKANNALNIITEPLDVQLEIPHLAYLEVKKETSKALLFTNPVDKQLGISYTIPVLMNLFGSFERVKLLMGDIQTQDIATLLKLKPPRSFKEVLALLPKLARLRFLSPKLLTQKGLCQEIIKQGDEVDLNAIPILKTWEEDGGKFITMGQCYTQSLDGSLKNLGMYRLQLYDKDHLGLHWQIHKDSLRILEDYQQAGQKMPVSIAIGGDPLYTWCATAPLPYGVYELMLYGFLRKQRPKMVRCITNALQVPYDVDFVIEGFVEPNFRDEGKFGDHTGFYTPIDPYPVLKVTAITSKKHPIYLASVVGKPPLEDKYLGYATERLFLPLLQLTTPNLMDYYMPENGVFHNLILAKIKAQFPAAAKQSMHAFWGVGQMSFVKHAIFVGEHAPSLQSPEIILHILNHFSAQNCLITEGICDALDHASPKFAQGGKLGVDCTGKEVQTAITPLSNAHLKQILQDLLNPSGSIEGLRQIYTQTKNPITLVALNKQASLQKAFETFKVESLVQHARIIVILDAHKNDLDNFYMLLWRVVNNIDAKRDVKILPPLVLIDATDKDTRDGHFREWQKETDCSPKVLAHLEELGYLKEIQNLKEFYRRFHIDRSYATRWSE